MLTAEKHCIAIVHPAGKMKATSDFIEERRQDIMNLGFDIKDINPELNAYDEYTAGPVIERALQLAFALTSRKFPIVMAARGGAGCTELIPYLENILPPVIPSKTLVGFSDISFLGVYLSMRYPNLRYIHAKNAYTLDLFSGHESDYKVLFDLLKNKIEEYSFPVESFKNTNKLEQNNIQGVCVPINLSLAESLACLKHIELPKNNILFIEECNEFFHRIIRKFDNLINSGFLKNTKAIVLGSFSNIGDSQENLYDRNFIIKVIANKLNIPIFSLPIFGHDNSCFPLVMKAKVFINIGTNYANVKITNNFNFGKTISTRFPIDLYLISKSHNHKNENEKLKVHMTGIGGTGMAQIAGLLQTAHYKVTGSDNPIYPPMDKVISDLGISPEVGFQAENIKKCTPDAIVLGNVISRIGANLNKNKELEEILANKIPVFSFPSILRKLFLNKSKNIIVSGTHGKTTTSSLVAHLLTELKFNPSYLIGGQPANFSSGFSLNSEKLFVLEGDEYDCAFFDKGPKFLHYEPKITLINNIEFDHADIYENVEAIEEEFTRLAKLTHERNGIIIANFEDKRVLNIVKNLTGKVIGFSALPNSDTQHPCWVLQSYKTYSSGTEISCLSPEGTTIQFKSQIFGRHNALNATAALAILQAHYFFENESENDIEKSIFLKNSNLVAEVQKAMECFKGVKRRFELICEKNNITVFDDFAHHPTAIETTLEAFRSYMKSSGKTGRLIACFDPRNATMRRKVLQDDLSKCFFHADIVYFGKVPKDLRMNENEVLDGKKVAENCGQNARYFDDNDQLLVFMREHVMQGDTVVFMSSGSFDGIPQKFASTL